MFSFSKKKRERGVWNRYIYMRLNNSNDFITDLLSGIANLSTSIRPFYGSFLHLFYV